MKKVFLGTFCLAVFICVSSCLYVNEVSAAVGINKQMPFHGTLADKKGKALSGTYPMRFRVYDVATGGSALWDTSYTVSVTNGSFSVLLGSGAGNELTIDFAHDEYYLGVTVGVDSEMTPRERLGASPYAFNADMLDGYHASDFVRANTAISIDTESASSLLTITQRGLGDILTLLDESEASVFSVDRIGRVSAAYIDIADGLMVQPGSELQLGGENGTSFLQDDTRNVQLVSRDPDGVVNFTTAGSLWLTANGADTGSPYLRLNEGGSIELMNQMASGDESHYLELNFYDGVKFTGLGTNTFENSSVEVLNNNALRFGSHADNGSGNEYGGISLSVYPEDVDLGPGVLFLEPWGSATENGSVDIATPGSLSLNTDSMSGPGMSFNASSGDVVLSTPDAALNTFTVNAVLQLPGLAGSVALETDENGNVIAAPSDERLKENVRTIDNALDTVLNLRGVRYEWKEKERFGTQTEVGFIAQELQTELPEVVRDANEYYSVKTGNVVAVVIEAIKELYVRVEEYFVRTERLEDEVRALRAELEALKGVESTVSQSGGLVEDAAPLEEVVEEEEGNVLATEGVGVTEEVPTPENSL